jgi:hypothetical protein
MKKCVTVILVVGISILISSVPIYSSGVSECSPAGTWYGGSYNPENAGYKYQYTFSPMKAGRFFAMADGAYNPDSLGAAVATTWTGEVVRAKANSYEIRLIALTTNDPTEPPEELPMIWAVRGDLKIDGCDTITITYTWFAIYKWDTVPFVDAPVSWNLHAGDDPIVETIRRMPTGTTLPKAPPAP